jgi:hypothetical protein
MSPEPSESVAVNWMLWVENIIALCGVSDTSTGALEEHPSKNATTMDKHTVTTVLGFILLFSS